ncbi:MAG: HlyD family type I secretion periplasmic adaptor subunit [Burkholderiales bacterium]
MKALNAPSFAALLMQSGSDDVARAELRRQILRTLVPLTLVVALCGVWSATAPLAGAVVAPGHLKVELNRKTVQHREGGIVREILVRDGQRVRAGEPLIAVVDLRSDADLNVLQDQLRAEQIRQARAAAEAALETSFAVPPTLTDNAKAIEHLARERGLFAARRRTLDELLPALRSQIRDAQAQVSALATQIAAGESSARFSAEELEVNDRLAREGFIHQTRLLMVKRAAADYRGRVGEYRSELALARQRVGELEVRIAHARNQYQSQAADELKEASAKVRELEERLRPTQDQVERQIVRSPVDGEVMAMRVSAVGEVIGPRDPILDIVPSREKLVVEARIPPEDIDYVQRNSAAEVWLTALDPNTAPRLPGTIVFVSPDRVTQPETGESWFVATVEVDASSLENQREIRLQAGMLAEVYVTTPERTLLEYLAKPITVFARRGMREP